MNLKPAPHRVLVKFHFPDESDESKLITPNRLNFAPALEDRRTRVECMAIGPEVTFCAVGDFLLLISDVERNLVPISKEPPLALIHDSTILGVIEDDSLPPEPLSVLT